MLIVAALIFALFECFMNTPFSDFKWSTILLMNIPYIVVFALGCKLPGMSKRELLAVVFCCVAVFAFLAYHYYAAEGHWVPTQVKKYPPQLYYTSYALACCFVLWMLRSKITNVLPPKILSLCTYIGSHTIWIYLWHIPFVMAIKADSVAVRYVLVYGIALFITYIQTIVVNKVVEVCKNQNVNRFLRTVFIG